MGLDTLKISSKFETTLFTYDSLEPEFTLEFDGYDERGSVDLTVEQAKELVEQLQQFIDLSEKNA